MFRRLLLTIILVFILGWLSNSVYSDISASLGSFENINTGKFITGGATLSEKASPMDRIKESDIHVYNNGVKIDIKNPEWSSFTDTNSMDPVLDKGANAIHIIPEKPSEINIGDIIAYDSKYTQGTLIHRVIDIGADEKGVYYILKGDNNPENDPGKVRFNQVRRVLVAIIY
ncbi:MAG: signal peptidase I [Nanobdellota archaeon]